MHLHMTKYLLSVLLYIVIIFNVRGQSQVLSPTVAYKISQPITLDGELDEEVWKTDGWATDFTQYYPSDTSLAQVQTQIKIAYDDEHVYIAAIMKNKGPRNYVSTSLRRDYRGEANDGITFVFDTFNDKTNAFQFGVNPYGVQREGLLSNGGQRGGDLNLAWDNKWYAVKNPRR